MGKTLAASCDKQGGGGSVSRLPAVEQYDVAAARHCCIKCPYTVGGDKRTTGAGQEDGAVGRLHLRAGSDFGRDKDPAFAICRMRSIVYLDKPGIPQKGFNTLSVRPPPV